ncbi:hypothetical protein T459_33272 [Capsicum annuum]|uniref:UspA domain-containing protein n=1 Tax=Capsicum annuum TaxID=4072 RepID=A0A2G2XZZ1_CAPAN|nr:hypothetical protein T459_33272 [Capsicum annuum]
MGGLVVLVIRHCVCSVVVVRYDDEKDGGNVGRKRGAFARGNEEEGEYHDACDGRQVESQRKLEDDFDEFTTTKSSVLAKPLDETQIPYKIHIVKDHDMKERLCLEVKDKLVTDNNDVESQRQPENDFDVFAIAKSFDLAKILDEAQIPYEIHIVNDHDMKERLCLEVERLGLSAVIIESRGFRAKKRGRDGRLGSVGDYCVRHCVCPVVVVRHVDEKDGGNVAPKHVVFARENEEEGEYRDAFDGRQGLQPAKEKGARTDN